VLVLEEDERGFPPLERYLRDHAIIESLRINVKEIHCLHRVAIEDVAQRHALQFLFYDVWHQLSRMADDVTAVKGAELVIPIGQGIAEFATCLLGNVVELRHTSLTADGNVFEDEPGSAPVIPLQTFEDERHRLDEDSAPVLVCDDQIVQRIPLPPIVRAYLHEEYAGMAAKAVLDPFLKSLPGLQGLRREEEPISALQHAEDDRKAPQVVLEESHVTSTTAWQENSIGHHESPADSVIAEPACPVCDAKSWRPIGSRLYRLADAESLSAYARKRYRVLFEVWHPGRSEIELTSKLCGGCGFVTNVPRPADEDLEAKYRFLGRLGQDSEAPAAESPSERARARRLFRLLRRHLPKVGRPRILDFGGGDGRLMSDFVAHGCECDVVDYRTDALPGVHRQGNTLADLPSDSKYDLVVCSHVIEHVADPLPTLQVLKEHLKPRGRLYVEVPMEIWGRAPLHTEPVTHVNFFTPASLRQLMERAGMRVSSCFLGGYHHPSGQMELAIRAIGGLADPQEQPLTALGNPAETEGFLKPSLTLRLRRRLLMPSTIFGALAFKLRRIRRRLLRSG
jgi:SAM-dependent methyltransferase